MRQGIGRALMQHVSEYLRNEEKCKHKITVNASPYGVDFIIKWDS